MKVLITGANGQLGRELQKVLQTQFPTIQSFPYSRSELDVTDRDRVFTCISDVRPDVIVHTAAYTKVDAAETDVDNAYRVNAFGTKYLAEAAESVGAKLVALSTDYVFDGKSGNAYVEFDPPAPQSVYGKSKWAGEQLAMQFCSRTFIVRTSWVFGAEGPNFVQTMLRLAQTQPRLQVVHDQIGSPTYAYDLAEFLCCLMQTNQYGIYHATNQGTCSWYEFACAIFEEAGISVLVAPCTTAEFPRPAPRPPYSVLDHMAIRLQGMTDLRPWREALRSYLASMPQGT